MEVMYLLIAFSLIIASGFLGAFIWAVRNGQFDDRDTPSIRMLVDDVVPRRKKNKKRVDRHGEGAAPDDPNGQSAQTAAPIHPKAPSREKESAGRAANKPSSGQHELF